MKNFKKIFASCGALCILGASMVGFTGCSQTDKTLVLRVSSWEEYIDEGGWDEEETIDLESGDIIGVNSMVDDFTEWFNDTHDFNIRVEYSTFGTNEDLYNRLSLGDVYDLVCPSDYMIMKLIAEQNYVPYSDNFWNKEIDENYYAKGVSTYIDGADDSIFNSYGWHGLAACYMWGTTGLVYNPEKINNVADVSTWKMLLNSEYKKQVTIKDNVRDAYFAALGIVYNEQLLSGITATERADLMNDVGDEAISKAEDVLKNIKENVYSFETDSGKADMVTGKVLANYQWSGDAVLIMDEAEDDGTELWYSVPDECTNIWFDGWLKLKNGVEWTEEREIAAEAFVNFLSRPDNAVRNMYCIGYTSAIADETVFKYMEWNYGAEDGETVEYDVSYFFGEGKTIFAPAENFDKDETTNQINRGRQLFAQYPPQNVIERSVVMLDFGEKLADLNQMWINVRCLDLLDISPVTIGVVSAIVVAGVTGILLYAFRYKIFYRQKPKRGYKKAQ